MVDNKTSDGAFTDPLVTPPQINNLLTSTAVSFSRGSAGLIFTAPCSQADSICVVEDSFSVLLDLSDLPWLKYDWNRDGSHAESPPAASGFFGGGFRGHDKIINMRETGP